MLKLRALLARRNRAWRGDARGATAMVVALVTCFVLFPVAALTVDLGNQWARRGQLQQQIDRAVIFAGNYLPAAKADSKRIAAKALIHYIACNPVAGQVASVNAAYPIPRDSNGDFSCPQENFDPTSTLYNSAATALMANETITFPNRFEIKGSGPHALVNYGFGGIVGRENAVEQKTAAAHVYSPGGLLPMGGSVTCLAAALNNTGAVGAGQLLGNVLPVNYFSAGTGATGASGSSATVPTWTDPEGGVATPPIVPNPVGRTPAWSTHGDLTFSSATLNSSGTAINVAFAANANFPPSQGLQIVTPLNLNLGTGNVYGWFKRYTSAGVLQQAFSTPTPALLGGTSITLPDAVRDAPGDWHVKLVWQFPTFGRLLNTAVAVTYTNNGSVYSQSNKGGSLNNGVQRITVPASLASVADLDNFTSCAKPVVSPRVPGASNLIAGDQLSNDMVANIRLGVDHTMTQHPNVATAAGALSNLGNTSVASIVSGALNNTSGLVFSCTDGVNSSVLDTTANHANDPNCLRVNSKRNWSPEFTAGFLTASGRLSCQVSSCDHGTFTDGNIGRTSGSVTYNNDKITDFITSSNPNSVLNDMLLTSLDTFLLPSVPVATPANAVSSDIYDSPRFFWAPVLTTAYTLPESTDETSSGYPVLTFRPTFITDYSPTPSGLQQLVSTIDAQTLTQINQLVANGVSNVLGLGPLSSLLTALGVGNLGQNLANSFYNSSKLEAYGLVIDKNDPDASKLKALRVMNINPGALPAVDPDFSGPVNDYFGSGPKVIRLVL